jgi:hypothetical protein
MEWTKEKPTSDGFYWWRSDASSECAKTVVYVMEYVDGRGLRVCWHDREDMLCSIGGEWSGPIPEPREPTPSIAQLADATMPGWRDQHIDTNAIFAQCGEAIFRRMCEAEVQPLSIDCLAGIDLPSDPNSRLESWFDMVDEMESAKDAT